MNAPVDVDELALETADPVLDNLGGRRAQRPRLHVMPAPRTVVGEKRGEWLIADRSITATGKDGFRVRHECGAELIVGGLRSLNKRRCYVCRPIPPSESSPDGLSREQRRSRRKHDVRARTVSMRRITKHELQLGAALYPDDGERELRPVVRGECEGGVRPCPFVSCRFHLYVDVMPRSGAIKENFPDIEVDQMGESCCLDVADRGGETLEDVGAIMNLTRERIRQVEVKALAKLERANRRLREFADEGPVGRRRLPVLEGGA